MLPNLLVKRFFLCLFFLIILFPNPSQAQTHQIDSLENLLAHTPADTNRVSLLNKLSRQYNNQAGKSAQALQYAQKALELAQQLEYDYGIAQAFSALGSYHYVNNQNREAYQHYKDALQYYQKANRKTGLALGYGNLAMVCDDLGMYARAMEYYLTSIKLTEELNDQELFSKNLSHLGILMLNQNNYEQALDYLFRALAAQENLPDKVNEGLTLNTIGVVYQEMKDYDKARSYLMQSLSIFDSIDFSRGKVNCYNNLGIVHYFLHQYDSAIAYYEQALQISNPTGSNQSRSIAMTGMAAVYLEKGEIERAVGLYKEALDLAVTHQIKLMEVDALDGLNKAYERLGDYKQAFQYQSKLLLLKDSIFNSENTRKLAQLEANYEVEKKQAEIQLLEKGREQERFIRNAMIAGIFAILLIAVLIISQLRLKIRKNRLIVEKSEEIAQKNRQLESQSQQLAQTNTQLAQQSVQLSEQAEKLQKLDEAKSHFFANISHEFRTPLTLILNNLLDRISHVRQQHKEAGSSELPQLQVMYRNAQRLLQLINQLLDLSKLESGGMKLSLKDGDLAQLVSVVYASFSSLADFRNIKFELSLPSSPLLCQFDDDKVEKILYNLLSNAFKFTPGEGKISLAVSLEEDPAKPVVQIVVQDSGAGIAAAQLENVFDRFYQGNQHAADEHGTGIGLALTKELVELHGGKIWAESPPGEGASFILQLPYLPISPESDKELLKEETIEVPESIFEEILPEIENPVENAIQGQEEGQPTILLVEDNKDLRKYIRKQLAGKYRVLESENGLQGVEKAFETIPDLIISDWMMPELSGIELCERLKLDERTSHIPIILLTALATDEGKLKGLETGADDYLTKPFDSRELAIRVHNLIENRRKLRERFSRELHLEPASIAVTSTDEKFLQKVMKIIEDRMGDWEFDTEKFGLEIGMSRMQLHRKLKALTGQAPGDFLRLMRLKRAGYLLENQVGNVSEVAYQVGFNNLSYFAKRFREHYGMNPNEFVARKTIPLSD